MTPSLYHLVRILGFVGCFLLCFSGSLHAQVEEWPAGAFSKADSVAALYPKHSLADLKNLSDKLTKPFFADVDKFRAIYRWVCTNIENDYQLYRQNKSRREKLQHRPQELKAWNQKVNQQVFQKLVHEHKTVCTGYAYLLKELAFHAGLTCQVIDGYGRTTESNIGGAGIVNHSWNAIKLNKQWYLCDATWSSGMVDPRQQKFIPQFSEAYFLADPSLFVLTHYPLDTSLMFLEERPTLHDFLNAPLVYKSVVHYQAVPLFPKTFQVEAMKGETVTFRFAQQGYLNLEKVELRIIKGTNATYAYPTIFPNASGANTIDHLFTSKGTFLVHLLFDNEYMFTYRVRVR